MRTRYHIHVHVSERYAIHQVCYNVYNNVSSDIVVKVTPLAELNERTQLKDKVAVI